MSPTSTNRSPRHRSTDVGDSDFYAVEARCTSKCLMTDVCPSFLWTQETLLSRTETRVR
ncbi:MAG: hypothetical protein K2H92_09220 [Bacteroidaceae bacterium]|nr:hypothetical protein [Bacteroidaceae bacterium]